MNNKNIAILAPHVDDEVIGCYRLLEAGRVSDVFYYYDLTNERKEEALRVADYFGFNAHFETSDFPEDKIFYVPNIADQHPHHKELNLYSRSLDCPKRYYSIDMNVKFDVLPVPVMARKLVVLHEFYPSQRKLIDKDDKYHLFESDLASDLFASRVLTSPNTDTIFTVEELYSNIPRSLTRELEDLVVQTGGKSYVKAQRGSFILEYKP